MSELNYARAKATRDAFRTVVLKTMVENYISTCKQ